MEIYWVLPPSHIEVGSIHHGPPLCEKEGVYS